MTAHASADGATEFRRDLGLLDAAVVVAGAIIGVGIFANPSNVARITGSAGLSIAAWCAGGLLALLGGFAYAELAARLPYVGGQYVYLARAWHPAVGFLYGVALLFIINGGAIAAVAILFARYVDATLLPLGPWGARAVAAGVLVILTAINVVGIRPGARVNNTLMAAKIAGILGLMAMAFFGTRSGAAIAPHPQAGEAAGTGAPWPVLILTALVPIMFAYGGWQNCGSIAGEIRDPARNLARANVLGVLVVVALYVGLNLAYLKVLSVGEIAASPAVAAETARAVAGERGARLVGALILVSALGFLAVIIQTAPRLYYAMARDGVFFARAGRLHPRFRTPVFTLWLQAAISIALLATNTYDQLLSFVVFADWLFFGLTVAGLFLLRRRDAAAAAAGAAGAGGVFPMPGYPWTTALFVATAAGIVINSFAAYTTQSLIGTGILLAAAAAYPLVARRGAVASASSMGNG